MTMYFECKSPRNKQPYEKLYIFFESENKALGEKKSNLFTSVLQLTPRVIQINFIAVVYQKESPGI